MSTLKLLLACALVAGAVTAGAELGPELRPGLGTAAPADFESVVSADGSGLPAGAGSVSAGRVLYARHCAACHGQDGKLPGNELAGGQGTLAAARPLKTVGSYWPYATTLFDYIDRAMPYGNEKVLSADEVYAVTAWVLHLNGILGPGAELDQQSLPAVRMPNRDGFVELMAANVLDYDALVQALAVRKALTIETHLTFLGGFNGPNCSSCLPDANEHFHPRQQPAD